MNSRGLLAGPHSITFDGKHVESTTLSSESGEYLLVFYDQTGDHEVAIIGTAVIPEFDSIIGIISVSFAVVLLSIRFGSRFIRK